MSKINIDEWIESLQRIEEWLDSDLEYHTWLDKNCTVDIDELYRDNMGDDATNNLSFRA